VSYELTPLIIDLSHRRKSRFNRIPKAKDGEKGDPGDNGISIVDAHQIDDKSFKFEFSDGKFSQAMDLPVAKDGVDAKGEPGKDGDKGDPGKKGRDGVSVVDVAIFSRNIVFTFSDGTKTTLPLKFPSGSVKNPGVGFGSAEATVKDIVGISPIKITDAGGIFTISLLTKVTPVTGAYTALPSDDDLIVRGGTFTIDLFSEALSTKDLSIMCVTGTITIDAFESETINGDLTTVLTTDQAIILVRDVGVGWRIK